MSEFVVIGIPKTPQTRRAASRNAWKARVNEAAKQAAASLPFMPGPYSAAIIYFYTGSTELDVDSIGKYILDGIVGILTDDDNLAEQVILRKTNQSSLILENPSPLLAEVVGNEEHFVYVKLGNAPNHREIPT